MATEKPKDLRERVLISEEERDVIEALLLTGTYEKEYVDGPIKVVLKEPKKENVWIAFQAIKKLLSDNDNENTFIEKKNDCLLSAYVKSFAVKIGDKTGGNDFSEKFDEVEYKLNIIKSLSRPVTDILVRALVDFQKLIETATSSEKLSNF